MKAMLMQQLVTKKLFYNKWPIKVECYVQGSYRVQRLGALKTLEWCDHENNGYASERGINKFELKKFTKKTIDVLEGQDIKVRTEGNHFNIFCKDINLLENIKKEMRPWITAITAPENDEQYKFLIENGHKQIICNNFPYEKFRFRVYIRENLKQDAREQFIQWLEKYPEKIQMANTTRKWLDGSTVHYVQNPFFYIVDEKMLSMVLLFLGNGCKKIQEFILSSNINT
jgi:hypothetical protein